jgi:hypothetical protein
MISDGVVIDVDDAYTQMEDRVMRRLKEGRWS